MTDGPILDERDIIQIEHGVPQKAKRVTLVDTTGTLIDGSNPLPVTTSGTSGVTEIAIYGSQTVVFGATTTIVTYTVPVGKKFKVGTINIGGEADGEFTLEINSSIIAYIRNSASEQTKNVYFDYNIVATAGQIVEIRAKNINYRKNAMVYKATLSGYTQ